MILWYNTVETRTRRTAHDEKTTIAKVYINMHIGAYDDEPATIAAMHEYAEQNGCKPDITDTRYHHEIYLSDPRKCETAKLKTVVRHPIKKKEDS